MHDPIESHRSGERGIAPVLMLFALSAFSVVSVAALSTTLGSAPAGRTFSIFRAVQLDALTQFVASMVVPNEWRTQGAPGSYQFQLPVIVPGMDGDENGAVSAWHAMTAVPGMAICCDAGTAVCSKGRAAGGAAAIEDWNPGPDDTLRLSFELTSQPDADPARGDMVTATVTPSGVPIEGATVSCHLAFDGAVIAHGTAVLSQTPRQDASALGTPLVGGTMTLAVRTK